MSEPTKVCVRVLKFESAIRYYIKVPLLIFCKFLVWISSFINWCIARSVMRWFGIPFAVYVLYYMMQVPVLEMINNSVLLVEYIFLISLSGTFGFMAWIEVPDKEREILNSYKVIEECDE